MPLNFRYQVTLSAIDANTVLHPDNWVKAELVDGSTMPQAAKAVAADWLKTYYPEIWIHIDDESFPHHPNGAPIKIHSFLIGMSK